MFSPSCSAQDVPKAYKLRSIFLVSAGLEAAVIGLKVGEQRKKTVPPEEGFGEALTTCIINTSGRQA